MLLRRQVSEDRDEHIDMTPMVDVVFQLMTFMLFSMQLATGETVEMPEARHGVGVEEGDATFLMVAPAAGPGGKPRLFVGTKGETPVGLDEAIAAVSQGVSEGRRKVVVQADGGVPHGEVIALIGEISKRESGVSIHVGVKEPQ
jgi:biopolymer transport protein ExbD